MVVFFGIVLFLVAVVWSAAALRLASWLNGGYHISPPVKISIFLVAIILFGGYVAFAVYHPMDTPMQYYIGGIAIVVVNLLGFVICD